MGEENGYKGPVVGEKAISDLREGQQGGGHRAGGRAAQSEDTLGRNEVVKGVANAGKGRIKALGFLF